jgi:hypothetical protein
MKLRYYLSLADIVVKHKIIHLNGSYLEYVMTAFLSCIIRTVRTIGAMDVIAKRRVLNE